MNVGQRFLGQVRLPVAIVGRRKRQPPDEHAAKERDKDNQLSPESPNEYEDEHERDREQYRRHPVARSEWSVKPYGAKCPGNSNAG
ncbi:MAG: hypothetical protein DME50_17000 [Verrucomicrobia bacterium]|nr:MAG: hypothetical protein DME50_17000 [Verrucomicrobiota bacterium]